MVVTRSCNEQQSLSSAKSNTLQRAFRAGTEGRSGQGTKGKVLRLKGHH